MMKLVKRDFSLTRPYEYVVMLSMFIIAHLISLPPYFLFTVATLSTVITMFYIDYRDHVQRFFTSLPIERKNVVWSRYVTAICTLVSFLMLQVGTMLLMKNAMPDRLYFFYDWQDIIIVFCIGVLIIACTIPFFHLFKSFYVSIIFIVFIFFTVVFQIVFRLFSIMGLEDRIELYQLDEGYQLLVEKYVPGQPYVTLLVATILLFIGSYFLSLYLFRRKELS